MDHLTNEFELRTLEVPGNRSVFGGRGRQIELAFSGDREHLLTGGLDETIRVWEVRTGRLVGELTGHDGLVTTLAMSPDGGWLASGGNDGTVRIWSTSRLLKNPGDRAVF